MEQDHLTSFSEDPSENLRIENEILKLKMQAESGAVFGSEGGLPPEIENAFLQNVQQFEEQWANAKCVKLYELVGKPQFASEKDLTDEQVKPALEKMLDLLSRSNIELNILGEYPDREIYRFVTEELFQHETNDMQIPGMRMNFIYEEFHPNHKMDIESRAKEFLSDWFEQKFSKYSWELDDQFILPDGSILTKMEVLERLNSVFQSYATFSNTSYSITEISFEWNDESSTGIGHVEGLAQYDAVLENGETLRFRGPFKLYMSSGGEWWNIFNFVFPGFAW